MRSADKHRARQSELDHKLMENEAWRALFNMPGSLTRRKRSVEQLVP